MSQKYAMQTSSDYYLRPKVAFDVDNTLITSDGEPIKKVIKFFKLFQEFGCEMYIWSNGSEGDIAGVDYAALIAKRLGLRAKIVEKGSFKPDITVDDLMVFDRISEKTFGLVNIRV